jgi:hypothetical protein
MRTRRISPDPIPLSAFAGFCFPPDVIVLAVRWYLRGLKQEHSARVVIAGHAFVQNIRRGHYELAAEEPVNRRLTVAFDELA